MPLESSNTMYRVLKYNKRVEYIQDKKSGTPQVQREELIVEERGLYRDEDASPCFLHWIQVHSMNKAGI